MEGASCSSRCQATGQASTHARRGWRMPTQRALRLRIAASTRFPVDIGGVMRQPAPDLAPATVVPGARTRPTPILSAEQMVNRLRSTMSPYGEENFGSFYSSAMGGIITEPALMMLPVDDQFVCKGYGVSETVILRDGYLYLLDEHMKRLKDTCEQTGLSLPFSDPNIRRVILDVAAASGKLNGQLRIWVTPGRGGFTPMEVGGSEPALYVLCLSDTHFLDRVQSWSAVTCKFPVQNNPFSVIPGNQHLLTSVMQAEAAADAEAEVTLYTDEEGFVMHASGYTPVVLTMQDIMVIPPDGAVPPSITLQRLLELMPEERTRSPNDILIREVQHRKLHRTEVETAKEFFLVCTTYTIAPVSKIDGKDIADGETGMTSLALNYMLDNDQMPPAVPGEYSPYHTPVPYGYMSGMRSQLV